jgi:hypothetical protein
VGVLLARHPGDVGEWLASGAAFDAAGADALWVDIAPEPELDPLALTAALAAVTFRSLLVTTLTAEDGPTPASDWPSEELSRTLATVGRLSRGRLRILGDATLLRDLEDVGRGLGVFCRTPGDPAAFDHTCGPGAAERWVSIPMPDGRASWRATLVGAAEGGTRGLLIPADPRLLDLLRNPGDPGHRHDLQLAVG